MILNLPQDDSKPKQASNNEYTAGVPRELTRCIQGSYLSRVFINFISHGRCMRDMPSTRLSAPHLTGSHLSPISVWADIQ